MKKKGNSKLKKVRIRRKDGVMTTVYRKKK